MMEAGQELFVKMALDAWNKELSATNKLLEKLSDEHLMNEVAPSRNRGIYLLGHLTAVNDEMMPLLRFQPALHPEMTPLFIDAADRAIADLPSALRIREQWNAINAVLMGHIEKLPASEWFMRHANITAADFPKEPHRNRLNVLLSRTNHMGYHRGQLALLAS